MPDQSSLSNLLRIRGDEILAQWERRLEQRRDRELDESGRPDGGVARLGASLLRRISEAVEEVGHPSAGRAEPSGGDGLDERADLDVVVAGLAELRSTILEAWRQTASLPAGRVGELTGLERAVGRVLTHLVHERLERRERLLGAQEALCAVALDSEDLDVLLGRAARVLADALRGVDVCGIFLLQGDRLSLRGGVGLEDDVRAGLSLKLGEGFAGRIAAERRPLLLQGASNDPVVQCAALRRQRVQALYGVPLSSERELLGVVIVGSRSSPELPEESRRVLPELSGRLGAHIRRQQQLIETQLRASALADSQSRHRRALERHRLAVEAGRLGEWDWNLKTGQLTWSRLQKRLFGVPDETVPTAALFDEILHPDDRARIHRLIESSLPEGHFSYSAEYRVRRPQGDELWMASHARVLLDDKNEPCRVIGVTQDVTDHKRSEEALAFLDESSRILSESLEVEPMLDALAGLAVRNLADYCLVNLATDGGLSRVAVARASSEPGPEGPRPYELPTELGLPVGPAVVARTGRPDSGVIDDAVLRMGARDEEHLARLRELGLRSYLSVPLLARNKILGAITFVSASSGRIYGEADVAFAQQLAQRAGLILDNACLYEEARRAVTLRDDLLAVVSHDLRNPLSLLKMGAGLLLQQADESSSEARLLQRMVAGADRMARLIDDLLDLGAIETGRLSVNAEAQDVAEVLAEAVEANRPMAEREQVWLDLEPSPEPVRVACDGQRMLQVLANLIGNAVKFSPRGDRVTLAAKVVGSEVSISVADRGPGIPAELREHLFEPYWTRADPRLGGRGLGLFIAAGIVHAHGGRIEVSDGEEGGTVFEVRLPMLS